MKILLTFGLLMASCLLEATCPGHRREEPGAPTAALENMQNMAPLGVPPLGQSDILERPSMPQAPLDEKTLGEMLEDGLEDSEDGFDEDFDSDEDDFD